MCLVRSTEESEPQQSASSPADPTKVPTSVPCWQSDTSGPHGLEHGWVELQIFGQAQAMTFLAILVASPGLTPSFLGVIQH